ncbi:MAG: methyltransferase domain-containing protein [Pseudomonadota bacterium]
MAETLTAERTLLHIGCGDRRLSDLPAWFRDGWRETRIDPNEAHGPDVTADLRDLSEIEDENADAIWCSGGLERLTAEDGLIAMNEFHAVLKPEGFIVLSTPDLRTVCRMVGEKGLDAPLYKSKLGPISGRDLIFGFQAAILAGREDIAHRNGFDLTTLRDLLVRAGFRAIYGERRGFYLYFIASRTQRETEAASAHLHAILGPREGA